jgi:M6 family metalloprotease-like protein
MCFPMGTKITSLLLLALALALWLESPARGVVCGAAKGAALRGKIPSTGRIRALALFGRFADQEEEGPPAFARQLFDPRQPGSLTHFYAEMSQGQFALEGEAIARWYASRQEAAAYVARPGQVGLYGRIGDFAREILEAADADLDLGLYDDDGPDGTPNSGDDDGYVDFVFLDVLAVPRGFIVGPATGIALLGLGSDFVTQDRAASGGYIRVRRDESPLGIGGVLGQGRSFGEAAASMAHEFGHALGLPDLFDKDFLRREAQDPEPELDSAGLGYWCLMAHGTRGWDERGGPNPFCAWALEELGWIGRDNGSLVVVEGELRGAGFEEVRRRGRVYKLPLRNPNESFRSEEYLLVEYRQPGNSFYERHLPGSGLLVWHVRPETDNDDEERKLVDLVCADGRYADAGYPAGRIPAPGTGGDNLDFWAHDPEYTRAHQGNLGDATDLFDGVRYTEFSAETNPAAPLGVSISRIRRQGEGMAADLRVDDRRWAGTIRGEVVWQDTVELVGDLVVPERALLRVLPGTLVLVSPAPSAFLAAGPARERVELVVQGGLRAGSSTGPPVRFTSAAAQPQPGDWQGILAEEAGVVYLENAQIEYARQGISGRGLRVPQTLVEVAVRHASQYGLWFSEHHLPLRLTRVRVEGAGLAGARVEGGGSVVVEESRFAFNGTGGYEQRGGTLDCRVSRFEANGLEVGTNLVLDGLAQGAVIGNHLAEGVGIYCDQVGQLRVEQNHLEGNRIGLISADSAPQIVRNEFVGSGIAVQITGGRVPARMALNALREVEVLLANQAATAVAAADNWWGEDDEAGIAARMQGRVEWRPFLRRDPQSLPAAFTLAQNFPNPFNGSTQIRLAVGVDEALRARGRNMELAVRNSAGQRVRLLLRQPSSPGEYVLVWDGRDDLGRPAASGVYHYQVEIGDLHLARRMLLVR